MIRKLNLFLAVLLVFTYFKVNAQPPIPNPNGRWVIDDADMIGTSTENLVDFTIRNHFGKTSNQIVVYTFTSLGMGNMEVYASEVFNAWKIGSKEKNNGVLFLVAQKEMKVRIEVGYGLESSLTDIECQDIIDHQIMTLFNTGDYDDGIVLGVDAIITAIDGTYLSVPKAVTQKKHIWGYIGIGIFILAFATISLLVRGKGKHGSVGGGFTRGGGFGGGFGGGGFSGGGGFGGGGGA